jgi:TolA-binding protein
MSNHQKQPQQGDPARIPALTHRHLEAVLQVLKRAQQPDVALIEQAEAQLRQIIVAIKPLSPEMLQQRLQTRRLTRQQLLDALRDGCDCLNVALDEYDEGNTQHCTQQVKGCQTIITEILTTW